MQCSSSKELNVVWLTVFHGLENTICLTQSDQSQIIVNHGHNWPESKPEQTT